MLTISARTDFSDVLKALDNLERGAPYAMATALTRTAYDVKDAATRAMADLFDKPTPYTLRSMRVWGANKTNLRAIAWLKDGNRPQHYLLPMIEGGDRPLKRFEERLRMLGYMKSSERAVPGTAAQLDNYGNMSRALIVKILSQLKTAVVQGDFSNASESRRSKAKRSKVAYFASAGRGSNVERWRGGKMQSFAQNLPAGIWERRVHAWGSSVRPVLLFVSRAKYGKRFDFFGIASSVIAARFPVHIAEAVRSTNERFFAAAAR